MSAKFYRTSVFVLLFLGVVGISSIGINLISRYGRTQQTKQLQQASEQLAQGQYVSAIAIYDELLETDFSQPEILWSNRGYAYLGSQQYQAALASCQQAITLDAKLALAWNCQGEAQFYLGNNSAAQTAFQRAIAIEPKNTTYQLNQSQVLQNLGQHRQALELNQKAIATLESQQSPPTQTLALAFKRQGQSWLEIGKNKEALSAFKTSLEHQPEDLATQLGKAISLYRLGKYELAIKTLDKILSRQDLTPQQQATGWLYQGISLCQTPKSSAADRAFDRVIKLSQNPEHQKIARAGCGIK